MGEPVRVKPMGKINVRLPKEGRGRMSEPVRVKPMDSISVRKAMKIAMAKGYKPDNVKRVFTFKPSEIHEGKWLEKDGYFICKEDDKIKVFLDMKSKGDK